MRVDFERLGPGPSRLFLCACCRHFFYADYKRGALIALTARTLDAHRVWSLLQAFVESQGCYGDELEQLARTAKN